jgi:hypothetical protein
MCASGSAYHPGKMGLPDFTFSLLFCEKETKPDSTKKKGRMNFEIFMALGLNKKNRQCKLPVF